MGVERRREGTKLENRDPFLLFPRSCWEVTGGSSTQDYRAGIWHLPSPEEQPSRVSCFSVGWWVEGSFLHCRALPGDAGQ